MNNFYTIYVVKPNDTLYDISNKFGVNLNRIIIANPSLNPNNIYPGMTIIIPLNNIVNPIINYSSFILERDIKNLKTIYPFLTVGSIGNSVMGKNIFYLKLGIGYKKIFYSASFHANEWITTPLLMKFVEDFSLAYTTNSYIYGYNARELYNNVSLYIVPMVNPDGVDLVTNNIDKNSAYYNNAKTISNNYSDIPFPDGWKANIEGVDLNLQFPVGWQQAKEIKYSQGFTSPSPRDFVGYGPLTAPESLAVYNFTLQNNFDLILAYHTQGQEIYWQFQNYAPYNAYSIGKAFSFVSGYTLADVPYTSSFAGYKDWFLQQYRKPGYTIEAGLGENPLPISQFYEIYNDNLGILILGMVL